MNVFHDEDRVLPGFTEFYLVSLSCFVVLAQSKRTRLLLLFLATCGVVIQACRWIQRPSSVFVGFRCQKKVVPGRGAAFVFFLCALQLFLVPRTLGTGRKPRSKLNCWLFFGSYLVLPSFLSRIPGFHNQNGLVPGRTGSWNTRTFRGLVPNWSRVPIIVTGFFFVVT